MCLSKLQSFATSCFNVLFKSKKNQKYPVIKIRNRNITVPNRQDSIINYYLYKIHEMDHYQIYDDFESFESFDTYNSSDESSIYELYSDNTYSDDTYNDSFDCLSLYSNLS